MGLAILIVALLTKIVIPPSFAADLSQAGTDYVAYTKYFVAGLILVMLVPFQLLNKKRNGIWWWSLGVITLVGSIVMLIAYNNMINSFTGYNQEAKEREVIGVHLMHIPKLEVDSMKKVLKVDTISADNILSNLGKASDNWPKCEIADNANKIILSYTYTISLFTLFILFSVQGLYCYQNKEI